jgi:uncharacterized protein
MQELIAASEQGDASAQNDLGLAYLEGKGINQNHENALKWLTSSANLGNIEAQFNLGRMYEVGDGVKRNIKTAIEWYSKAAKQGDEPAIKALQEIKNNEGKY